MQQPLDQMNRTGIACSPENSRLLQEFADSCPPDPPGSDASLAQLRETSIQEAETIGAVPEPGNVMAAAQTGAQPDTQTSAATLPELLIDKLGERLAFERTSVRVYDAMLAKAEAQGENGSALLQELQHFRDEEAEHFRMVSDCIATLDGDPTAQTPAADAAAVASSGVLQVVGDPRTDLFQSLNALLAAELIDNAGWELLIMLSEKCGHAHMVERFRQALQQEDEHLDSVTRWIKDMAVAQLH
ncbi:MAG: ferritin-like domain-containing protein [Burkholderiaceae bacterium]